MQLAGKESVVPKLYTTLGQQHLITGLQAHVSSTGITHAILGVLELFSQNKQIKASMTEKPLFVIHVKQAMDRFPQEKLIQQVGKKIIKRLA